ncbi:MAG: hypothetical protein GY846_02790 [Deltaproteobacteria bacterium]|nr:hypothetical protein [Deltaproteobacteria bacterium]
MKGKMCFPTMLITLMMVVLAGALSVAGAEQEEASEPSGNLVGPRPGKTDPVHNPSFRMLLAQKQLMAVMPYRGHFCTNVNKPSDENLQNWYFVGSDCSSSGYDIYSTESPTAVAAGRVVTPLRDDAFGVSYVKTDKGYGMLLFSGKNFIKPYEGYYLYQVFDELDFADYEGSNLNTLDIAIGDIDGALEEDGETHEEIVIAYKGPKGASGYPSVYVSAIKAIPDKHTATVSWQVLDTIVVGDIPCDLAFLSLTTGDYNNDSVKEITVSWPSRKDEKQEQNFMMKVLSYDADKKTLQVGASGENLFDFRYNMVDIASGDFDGDGMDELAAVFSSTATNTQGMWTYIQVYEIDLKKKAINFGARFGEKWYVSSLGASITSGFFKFDPDNGYSAARRQFAVAHINDRHDHTSTKNSVDVFSYEDTCDENGNNCGWKVVHKAHDRIYWDKHYYFNTSTYKPEIVAGRFLPLDYTGSLQGPTNRDQIAVSWSQDIEGKTPELKFTVYYVDNDWKTYQVGDSDTGYYFYPSKSYDSTTHYAASAPIVAACAYEGESYYLGSPAHITFPHMIKIQSIIQEPPKHLDYVPDQKGDWKIVNASKYREFYSQFKNKNGKAMTKSDTHTSNYDVAASEVATAKQTFSVDFGNVISGSTSLTETLSLGYNYNHIYKKVSGSYESFDTSITATADRDDYLSNLVQLMDIWRYPIYGMKTKDGKNAFYEVVLPGPKATPHTWGTLMADYYQPIHENGNLLSYPPSDSDFPKNYDLGNFYVGGDKYLDLMAVDSNTYQYGDGKIEQTIAWAKDASSASTVTNKHTMTVGLDVKYAVTGKAGGEEVGGKWSYSFDTSLSTKDSWSHTDYSKTDTKTSSGVSVVAPDYGGKEYAYSFQPFLYSTKDGTLKMAHTVNPTDSSAGFFWPETYGYHPDLSLNLPIKYWYDKGGDQTQYGNYYMYETRQHRSRMRGLFLLKKEPTKVKEKIDDYDLQYVGNSPRAGDTIYVLAYVYNYSLATGAHDNTTGKFVVRFSYSPGGVDPGNQPPDLTTIGEVEVLSLAPRERKSVYVKWEIPKDLGGDVPGAGKPYRFYVTLDPDNDVPDEIHELHVEDQSPAPKQTCPVAKGEYSKECGIFCGSNNQGYWPWDNSFMIYAPKAEGSGIEESPTELSLVNESLEIDYTPESERFGYALFTELTYRLKLKILSSRADQTFRELLFYDNDESFSIKRAFGLNQGENDFYCNWTPGEPGEHTLKVWILEEEDDPVQGNNVVSLDVDVLPFERPIHR